MLTSWCWPSPTSRLTFLFLFFPFWNSLWVITWSPSISIPNFVPIHEADVKMFYWVIGSSDLMMALDGSHEDSSSGGFEKLHRFARQSNCCSDTSVWTRVVEWLTISQHLRIILIPTTGICIFCNSYDQATAHQYSILLWVQQQQQLLTGCPPSPTHGSGASQCQWSRWRNYSVYLVLRTNVFQYISIAMCGLLSAEWAVTFSHWSHWSCTNLLLRTFTSTIGCTAENCLGSSVLRPSFIQINLETHVVMLFRSCKGAPWRLSWL